MAEKRDENEPILFASQKIDEKEQRALWIEQELESDSNHGRFFGMQRSFDSRVVGVDAVAERANYEIGIDGYEKFEQFAVAFSRRFG